MDIFKALTDNHDRQRQLCRQLSADKTLQQKKATYAALHLELIAHAAAEERHLYVPVMAFDDGLDLSRHAIAEHHEMDEMMATLNDGRTGETRWLETADALAEKVVHHLKEEEDTFFKQARRILDNEQIKRLGGLYETEYSAFKDAHA